MSLCIVLGKRKWALSVFVVVALAFVSTCKKKSSEASAESSIAAPVNEMGQNVFQVNCATCHGANGEGDGPAAVGFNPRNFKKDKFKNGANMEGIQKTLNSGIPGTQMVAWKGILSDDQMKAVAEYVLSLVPTD